MRSAEDERPSGPPAPFAPPAAFHPASPCSPDRPRLAHRPRSGRPILRPEGSDDQGGRPTSFSVVGPSSVSSPLQRPPPHPSPSTHLSRSSSGLLEQQARSEIMHLLTAAVSLAAALGTAAVAAEPNIRALRTIMTDSRFVGLVSPCSVGGASRNTAAEWLRTVHSSSLGPESANASAMRPDRADRCALHE
jgi:hypothetical protein